MIVAEEDLGGYKFNQDVTVTIGEGDTIISVLLDKVILVKRERRLPVRKVDLANQAT